MLCSYCVVSIFFPTFGGDGGTAPVHPAVPQPDGLVATGTGEVVGVRGVPAQLIHAAGVPFVHVVLPLENYIITCRIRLHVVLPLEGRINITSRVPFVPVMDRL